MPSQKWSGSSLQPPEPIWGDISTLNMQHIKKNCKEGTITWCSCASSCPASVTSLTTWRWCHWLNDRLQNVVVLTVIQCVNVAAASRGHASVLSSYSSLTFLPLHSYRHNNHSLTLDSQWPSGQDVEFTVERLTSAHNTAWFFWDM